MASTASPYIYIPVDILEEESEQALFFQVDSHQLHYPHQKPLNFNSNHRYPTPL
jgi:hypothetical protein